MPKKKKDEEDNDEYRDGKKVQYFPKRKPEQCKICGGTGEDFLKPGKDCPNCRGRGYA